MPYACFTIKKKKKRPYTYFQIHIHCGNFQIPQCYLKAIIPLNLIIPIRVRFICVKHPYVEPGWVQTSLPSGCTIEISGKESVFPFLCRFGDVPMYEGDVTVEGGRCPSLNLSIPVGYLVFGARVCWLAAYVSPRDQPFFELRLFRRYIMHSCSVFQLCIPSFRKNSCRTPRLSFITTVMVI